MINFDHIEQYRENNRIEAKRALGGLPHSIWETYAAFANTLGGIILLGVEEHADKSLHPVNLPEPERLIREFWRIINQPKHVSINLLTSDDVTIEEVDGKRMIAIRVPRAAESERPVYIGTDPLTGSYLRSGEGDYRCTVAEVREMQRNAVRAAAHHPSAVSARRSLTRGKHRTGRAHKRAIITYLTAHVSADETTLASALRVGVTHIRAPLRELIADDILVCENKVYRLKR